MNPRKKQEGSQAHGFDAFLPYKEAVFHVEMLLGRERIHQQCICISRSLCTH